MGIFLSSLLGCVQIISDVPIAHAPEHTMAHGNALSKSEAPDEVRFKQDSLSQSQPQPSGEILPQQDIEDIVSDGREKRFAEKSRNISDNGEEKFAGSEILPEKQPSLKEVLELCEKAQIFWQDGENESAMRALDQAYAMFLKMDTDEDQEAEIRKEEVRLMISKRIMEVYASRNIVANGGYKAIPLEMNKHVKAEIRHLIRAGKGKTKFLARAYRRSGRYRPYIVEELRKAGLPEELSWLPLIESGFRVYAMSEARALGLWQFIQSTGAKFGLVRNRYVDERLDPYKSTRAAIAYLKELHGIFGDWTTVLAAYNCGEERVLRIIRKQNVNYLDNFWDLYKLLPKETARYVPRFLATLHIVNNPEKYGLHNLRLNMPPKYETMTTSRKMKLGHMARTLGIKEKQLKELNPELRHGIVPGNGYRLRIPDGMGNSLLAKSEFSGSSGLRIYRVRQGDVPYEIAERHKMSLKRFLRLNRLTSKSKIYPGQKLRVVPKK